MDKDILTKPPEFKLYSDRSVYVGTLLGGPLVAGYLVAENFKELGEHENAKKTWIFAIIASIIIFGGVFIIPGIEKVPKLLIPILYSVIAQAFVKRFQGTLIKNHLETGGQVFSVWRSVAIGIIGLAITFIILFLAILLTDKQILI